MNSLPDDVARAIAEQPALVRAYALEQALTHALAATEALAPGASMARAHVQCISDVSRSWSTLAEALRP